MDIRRDLLVFLAESTPLITSTTNAAPAILDVSLPSIQLATGAQDWTTLSKSGAFLAAAVLAIRARFEGINATVERELGRLTGAHLDQALYAVTQVQEYSHLGALCDMLLDGGFAGRQFVQTADPAVRQAWDFATGIVANGGATLSDEEYHASLSAGAWLSERQRVGPDPEPLSELMTAWVTDSLRVLEGVPSLGLLVTNGDAAAAWRAMLNALDEAYKLDRAWWLAFSAAAGCTTPLAAHESGRDIVYLVSGASGGAAVRYSGGENYRQMPDSLDLPRAGLRAILELDAQLNAVGDLPPADLIVRSGLIDEVRRRIGDDIVGPLLKRWPDLRAVTVIPLGIIQRLPLATALVEGARFNALVDVTVAPNAAGVLVAANGGVCTAEAPVVVMADPAEGEGALGWVESEALAVAGVYGRSPDLLVDYGRSPASGAPKARASLERRPTLNTTSEHVLTRLENARVIHLACHGNVPDTDGLPALYLHGILTFDALEHHRFADGATVVLSACSVGSSIRSAPFAQLGFPAMLLATGASEVIASSEPLLDCRETVDFMVALHERLRAGVSASHALRDAMRDAEQSGVGSAIWGTLQVHGARVVAES
ncbi:hypothetical protein SRABI128_02353 [Microbacterium sp. Bi128]|nr:hypothetical protein SRABI128_02353 [Microbacterium sp. Bi128]